MQRDALTAENSAESASGSRTSSAPCLIRPIAPSDNAALEQIVRSVLAEFGCVGPGYASSDPELTTLYQVYTRPRSGFWVVSNAQGECLGGGGYAPLNGDATGVWAEVQKFYFLPQARGLGLGRQVLSRVIEHAKQAGYHHLYLETVEAMRAASVLYQRAGFESLSQPKGSTGHHACTVWMHKDLLAGKIP